MAGESNYFTVYDPTQTGIAPPGSVRGTEMVEHATPLRDQLERWYFKPLREMKGAQAFPAMILAIILIEKWLRVSQGYGDGEFCQGSKPVRELARLLEVEPDAAYWFWQDWRNGLLHRAMPKAGHFDGYTMSADYKRIIEVDGKHIRVNPWLFRDRVLEVVSKDRDLWKDQECPLAKEFMVIGSL
jgi:hypothetical protein